MKRDRKNNKPQRKLELSTERLRELTKKDQAQVAAGNVAPQPMGDTNNTGI